MYCLFSSLHSFWILASRAVFSSLFHHLFFPFLFDSLYFTLFISFCHLMFICLLTFYLSRWSLLRSVLVLPLLPPLPCSLSPDEPRQVSVLQVRQYHFDLPGSLEHHRLDCEEENARGWSQNLLLQLGVLVLQLQLQLHGRQHLPNRQRGVLVWVCRREDQQCRQHHHHWYCKQHTKQVLIKLKATFNRSDFHQSVCLTKWDFGGGTKCNRNTFWQWTFLQTTDVLNLYVSSCSVFICIYFNVSTSHQIHLVWKCPEVSSDVSWI